MKHIVFDARELRTSSGRYNERLLHYLQQVDKKHRYTVLLKPGDFDWWQPTNPNFQKLVCPYKEFTFGEQLGYLKQIKSLRADLVHFTFVQQPILYRGKVVTTMQDLTTVRFRNPSKNWLIFTIKQQVYKMVNKIAARKSAHIITPTEFVKRDVAQYTNIPLNKITVTYEAADVITDRPEPVKGLENQPFIMYVGRPLPHKNLERLIEAHAKLRSTKHPKLKLVLVGKTDSLYERIANKVKEQGREGVVFTGFISEGQLRWLYEHTAAYAFPSLSEGFGLPALEAMQHGAPVVSSNATCSPEVYRDGAHYFNPFDTGDMVEKISEVLDDNKLRGDLITKGRQVAASYSWQRMAEQTLGVYGQVLGE